MKPILSLPGKALSRDFHPVILAESLLDAADDGYLPSELASEIQVRSTAVELLMDDLFAATSLEAVNRLICHIGSILKQTATLLEAILSFELPNGTLAALVGKWPTSLATVPGRDMEEKGLWLATGIVLRHPSTLALWMTSTGLHRRFRLPGTVPPLLDGQSTLAGVARFTRDLSRAMVAPAIIPFCPRQIDAGRGLPHPDCIPECIALIVALQWAGEEDSPTRAWQQIESAVLRMSGLAGLPSTATMVSDPFLSQAPCVVAHRGQIAVTASPEARNWLMSAITNCYYMAA